MTYAIYFGLAFILFLIQNWIGSRSYSKGYVRFSLLDEQDEAISFNYAVKVFGPLVYLILCVAILQYFQLNEYVSNIIYVIYFYIILRLLIIILYGRGRIVNWWIISIYYLSIILIACIFCQTFIDKVNDILPDFSELKNEIWLLIIIFIYQIGNNTQESTPANQIYEPTLAYLPELKNRKKKYILRNYTKFSKKYSSLFPDNPSLQIVIISILIFENFNRPQFIRLLERIWVRVSNKPATQGIMQIAHSKPLSDIESVRIGCSSLNQKYLDNKDSYKPFRRTIKYHCPDRKYIRQILFISKAIIDNTTTQRSFNDLYSEITDEFSLYD